MFQDGARPQSDTVRDANRKPAETLAFAGFKTGDKIAVPAVKVSVQAITLQMAAAKALLAGVADGVS